MNKVVKTFPIETLARRKDGGRIRISTGAPDRDRDRVAPTGARIDNYLKNPVVQWGHNYRDPWATIGKTTKLEISPEGIIAEFELRPPANESDPQNIIRLLWEQDWVRTASIGFMPLASPAQNDMGGHDFSEWELLEWSMIPVPSNQEALRLAVKGLDVTQIIPVTFPILTQKRGRVLSARNEEKLRAALSALQEVLAQLEEQPTDDGKLLSKSPPCRQAGESEDECRSRKIREMMDEGMEREQAVAAAMRMCSEMCESKAALPPHESPKADPDTTWDGPGVVASLPAEREVLRRVHAWVDEKGDPDAKQSYKFPHHLADGRVVLRGVNNARARLPQASLPEADRAGVERHLTRHQEQFEQASAARDYARALVEFADELSAPEELADSLSMLLDTLKEVYVHE